MNALLEVSAYLQLTQVLNSLKLAHPGHTIAKQHQPPAKAARSENIAKMVSLTFHANWEVTAQDRIDSFSVLLEHIITKPINRLSLNALIVLQGILVRKLA